MKKSLNITFIIAFILEAIVMIGVFVKYFIDYNELVFIIILITLLTLMIVDTVIYFITLWQIYKYTISTVFVGVIRVLSVLAFILITIISTGMNHTNPTLKPWWENTTIAALYFGGPIVIFDICLSVIRVVALKSKYKIRER